MADFGTAAAAKRGRSRLLPYVPIIDFGEQPAGSVLRTRTEQIRGRAFADRDLAVAYAQRVIDARTAQHERHLVTPRMRALREQEGLPRELVGVLVTDAEQPDRIGQVVTATAQERAALRHQPIASHELGDWSLVEWPDGCRAWCSPYSIRIYTQRGTQ